MPKKSKSSPAASECYRERHFHVTIPGILARAVPVRRREFGYRTFSPFAIELICFDLRHRFPHIVTQPIACQSLKVRDAVDRLIVATYRPGAPRNRALIAQLLENPAGVALPPNTRLLGSLRGKSEHIYFPEKLSEALEIRWRELEYSTLSAYVTGLIRYDLALGGPHRYFNGEDTDPEILAALDEETLRMFHAPEHAKIRLEFMIEDVAGRELTREEHLSVMRRLGERLRENALKLQRKKG